MPTYQYKREDGSTFEVTQKMSDDPLTTCPETGQQVKRVITGGSGVVFKGDGWYVTDYKNKSNGSADHSSENGDGKQASGKGKTENSDTKANDSGNKASAADSAKHDAS